MASLRSRICLRALRRLAVVRAGVLHLLDDRRVRRLRREAGDVEVLVGLAADLLGAGRCRSRTTSHGRSSSRCRRCRCRAGRCRTSACSSSPGPRWAGRSAGARSPSSRSPAAAPSGTTGRSTAATRFVDTNGMSGRPVVAPVESLQLRISSTDASDTADVPTAATSFSTRLDLGVGGGVGVELRVVEVDHDLAPGETAAARLAVQVLRRALDCVLRALEQVRARSGCRRRRSPRRGSRWR